MTLPIIIVAFVFAIVVNSPVSARLPRAGVLLNQTSYGHYRQVSNNTEDWKIYSAWLQDDLHKQLLVSVGKRGLPEFMADYYFFNDRSYTVTYAEGSKSTLQCTMTKSFNYHDEAYNYATPPMSFLGLHTLFEFGLVPSYVFAGQARDGVGLLNNLLYTEPRDNGAFLGMVILGSLKSGISFSEYWYGANYTRVAPPPSTFELPAECQGAREAPFLRVHLKAN